MQRLEITRERPEENLALDDALLEEADAGQGPGETLRLWESPQTIVVAGRSTRIEEEIDVAACRRLDIPILRRSSGGASIVAGPGCLMYAVVLSCELRPQLQVIEQAHRFVLQTMVDCLQPLAAETEAEGISDLTLRGKKFSGNSLRCKRTHLLYHGALLYDFPLETIGLCLKTPPRQPDYREGRTHDDFVTNAPLEVGQLREAIIDGWGAHKIRSAWPQEKTVQLADEKYSQDEWIFRI